MELITSIVGFLKSHQLEAILGSVFLLVEYWLGKTTWVTPGSTLEVVLKSIVWFKEKIFLPFKKK